MVAAMTIEEATDGDIFLAFIEQVLRPALKPGDVVVMDTPQLAQSCRSALSIEKTGAELLYLPPYSPDMNPIEKAWAKLKELLRAAQPEHGKLLNKPSERPLNGSRRTTPRRGSGFAEQSTVFPSPRPFRFWQVAARSVVAGTTRPELFTRVGGESAGVGEIADEEEFASGADLPQIAEFAECARDTDAMGADEEADFFVGERKGDGPASGDARSGFARDIDQYLVEAVVEVGLGESADLFREVLNAAREIADDGEADGGVIEDKALEKLALDAAEEGALKACSSHGILAFSEQDILAEPLSGAADVEGEEASFFCDLPELYRARFDEVHTVGAITLAESPGRRRDFCGRSAWRDRPTPRAGHPQRARPARSNADGERRPDQPSPHRGTHCSWVFLPLRLQENRWKRIRSGPVPSA